MTQVLTRTMLASGVVDANEKRVHLGDRVLDLNSGLTCVVLDHCPELGPDCVYVQIVEHDGLVMSFWADPKQLMKIPREAA
ncbi:MAG: hypothetical protein KF696_13745 [Planctomycetes bacterium]|nr:hypothetical protein [Planctomycetota bacterium]MCW8137063.1 hypothetical protein [Planctomycetota bacterium]